MGQELDILLMGLKNRPKIGQRKPYILPKLKPETIQLLIKANLFPNVSKLRDVIFTYKLNQYDHFLVANLLRDIWFKIGDMYEKGENLSHSNIKKVLSYRRFTPEVEYLRNNPGLLTKYVQEFVKKFVSLTKVKNWVRE